MAERLVLHIGAMKSGTSFIQGVLSANRETLAEQGFTFPGRRWRNQVSAVRDLMERGGKEQEPLAPDGPWRRMAAEVNAWEGTAIISMEFLGPRNAAKIKEILRSFPDTRVEAVLTVRDFARSIPAMWQESMQNGGTTPWEEFLEVVRTEDTNTKQGNSFWRHQGTAGIARRWSSTVGKDRFTLVTVPPPEAPTSELWERFAAAVGLDPAPFDLQVRRNPSVGAASASVMRALNERLQSNPMPRQMYSRYVKHGLAKEGLASRKTADRMFELDEPWVIELGEREVQRLRDLDLRVVGSLDDLQPRPVAGVAPGSVTAEQQLEAALDGLAHVLKVWSGHQQRNPDDDQEDGS